MSPEAVLFGNGGALVNGYTWGRVQQKKLLPPVWLFRGGSQVTRRALTFLACGSKTFAW